MATDTRGLGQARLQQKFPWKVPQHHLKMAPMLRPSDPNMAGSLNGPGFWFTPFFMGGILIWLN